MVEYALTVSLVALASTAALAMPGNNILSLLTKVAGEV
jgi:Flp pilus assembly pilin Flp